MHYGLERVDSTILESVIDIINDNLKKLFILSEKGDEFASGVFDVVLSDKTACCR